MRCWQVVEKLNTSAELQAELAERFRFLDAAKKLILVTGHRRENFGEGFRTSVMRWLTWPAPSRCADPVPGAPESLCASPSTTSWPHALSNVHLIEPVDYLPFVYLMNRSHLIITDSGGVQEEAPSLGKPVLVMRDTTERPRPWRPAR
jgi:UDP-N-acetylglucosamine 2-epimerase (non-hydrolysing)